MGNFSFRVVQEDMFKVAGVPMVENCIAGYNSCMFAYGQVNCRFHLLDAAANTQVLRLCIILCLPFIFNAYAYKITCFF